MTTYVSDAYLAADYAVPMVKALSFTPLFEAAVASFPGLTRVWSLRSWPFAGAFAPLARGILPQRVSQQYGGLTTPDHVARLSILHPDYRLAYLSEVGFSDDDVVASAEIVDQWLDISKPSLEETSVKAFEAGEGLDWIMKAWSYTKPYDPLDAMIRESSIPEARPLVCYAVCTATEFALSMLMLHQMDSGAEPVLGGSDAEWAEEDQRIASLGLLEEVSQWPV